MVAPAGASATIESMPDRSASHWKRTYAERHTGELSWTESVPAMSLELIAQAGLASDAAIIDMGGGASRLAAELLGLGHSDERPLALSRS